MFIKLYNEMTFIRGDTERIDVTYHLRTDSVLTINNSEILTSNRHTVNELSAKLLKAGWRIEE